MLKIIYSFFIGALLAVFIGLGIAAFYTQPTQPSYPSILNFGGKEPTSQQIAVENQYNNAMNKWNEKMKTYNQNVSMMALVGAIILVALSLLLSQRIKTMADGVMLGGFFSLIYSVGRGIASHNSKYSFVVVGIGLVIALLLGYSRFIKPDKRTDKPEANAPKD